MPPKKRKLPINIVLNVRNYSVRIYPGQLSSPPDNYAGKDLGYIILSGDSTPAGLSYWIHFLPDGTNLPPANFDELEHSVQMSMNWCQFGNVMTLLATADSVHGIYNETNGVPWADVEGQFGSVPLPARRKETAGKIKKASKR